MQTVAHLATQARTSQSVNANLQTDSDSLTLLERVEAAIYQEYQDVAAQYPDATICPYCKGQGAVTLHVNDWRHPFFGRAFTCPCGMSKQNMIELLRTTFGDLGLPESHAHFTFDSFLERCSQVGMDDLEGKQLAYSTARRLAGEAVLIGRDGTEKYWLVLSGLPGVGKSGLLAASANHCISRGVPTLFRDFNEINEGVQGTYRPDYKGPSKAKLMHLLQSIPCLAVDEMGDPDANNPKVSDDVRKIWRRILGARHERRLLTFISTNLRPEEFAYTFGVQINRRVQERAVFIEMRGADLSTY